MKKEETIRRYGEETYKKQLEQSRAWSKAHRGQSNAAKKKWREEHPETVAASNQEQNRKGGRRYDKHLEDNKTGLRGERNAIRKKHADKYRPFKQIIAPESQIHHEWVPKTAEYRGLALVEAEAHQYGIVDVIEILEGKITLLTEEEVRKGKRK